MDDPELELKKKKKDGSAILMIPVTYPTKHFPSV